MTGVTTNSYTQDARERTGRRKKAWWCVSPRPKGHRSRHASVRRWRSSLLCSPFAVSRGAETKGLSDGRPARRGPSVIETRRVGLALLGLASRGVVVGMTVKPRKAERAHTGEVFPHPRRSSTGERRFRVLCAALPTDDAGSPPRRGARYDTVTSRGPAGPPAGAVAKGPDVNRHD
jgi:hypothetical protein